MDSIRCLKKNLDDVVVVVVVSHIQRIGCQSEKTTLHGGQSRSWSVEQGKYNKRKSLAAYHPSPHSHTARSEKIINKNHATCKVFFLKKNQTTSRPSVHPPVMGGKCQNV